MSTNQNSVSSSCSSYCSLSWNMVPAHSLAGVLTYHLSCSYLRRIFPRYQIEVIVHSPLLSLHPHIQLALVCWVQGHTLRGEVTWDSRATHYWGYHRTWHESPIHLISEINTPSESIFIADQNGTFLVFQWDFPCKGFWMQAIWKFSSITCIQLSCMLENSIHN